jgi:flagellar motor switch protein FliN
MTRLLRSAVETWQNEFVQAMEAAIGQHCSSTGEVSDWTDFQDAEGGEWFAQRFSDSEAAAWVHIPAGSQEILHHYLKGARLIDLISPAVPSAPPAENDGEGCSIQIALPAGTCSLGVVFNPGAVSLLQPQRRKTAHSMAEMELMLDMELPITVSIGSTQIPLRDVLKLTTGSIVELDRLINDPVDILVSNRVIARGEVVVIEGNYGVRILEIVSRSERMALRGGNRRGSGATAVAMASQNRASGTRMEAGNE